MFVADWSYARPGGRAVAAAGYGGVVRYLSHETGKDLSPGERDDLFAAGLHVGLVWETTANRALGGFDAGRSDAAEANAHADALGWPGDKVIAYAVDFDASGSQLSAVADYFRGAKTGRRPVGAYGSYGVLEYLAAHEPPHCFWQCAAWSGSGTGTGGSVYVPDYGHSVRRSQHACLFQYYGSTRIANTDHNETVDPVGGMSYSDLLWHPSDTPPDPGDVDMVNWRPYRVSDGPNPDAEYMVTWDGGGRPRRLYLAPGDPQFFWGASWLQDANPIVLDGDAGRRFLQIPEAGSMPDVSSIAAAVVTAITPLLPTGGVDLDGLARRIVSTLGDALRQ